MTEPRARFVIVVFTWRKVLKTEELEPLFNTAVDWLRFSENGWILWTTNDPPVWFKYIKPHLAPEDSVFIAELNLSHFGSTVSGWQSKMVWDWIKKSR
ncbi:MAG TPA: hypothetical protein VFF64_23705 [Candidatus Eremiobacteraceae bacterium]|nr:hypothetical protein [Candidatus Eremiobacteraceae bacterium]